MTREEAINELKIFNGTTRIRLSANFWEALNMAIKALEQEPLPSTQPEPLVKESHTLVKNLVKDTISRQIVLSKIKEVCFSEEWLQFRVDNGSNGQRDFLINYIKQLPPVTPTQRWIPVSERLPKSSGVYIVSRWFSDGEENAILTDANYYDGDGYWYNDNRINWGRDLVTDKVVAWMPLPEPYKAESEG